MPTNVSHGTAARLLTGGLVCGLLGLWACTSVLGDDFVIVTSPAGGSSSTSSTNTGGSNEGGAGGVGGAEPQIPSCAGLPATCGPNGDEDCCASPTVDGGTYYRCYDGIQNYDDTNPASVDTFRMDRFEVTVGRFRAFVEAGMGTQQSPPSFNDGAHPLIDGSGWQSTWNAELLQDSTLLIQALKCNPDRTWTDAVENHETLPMNCVSWYEAFAFCAWDGGRLPTEAEWNHAAAGGDQQRFYPWSDPYPPGSSDLDPTYAVYYCTGDGSAENDCAFSDVQTVGSRSPKGDGRWGQADLAGGIWEWTLDLYADFEGTSCDNCANLDEGTDRVTRGGSWYGYIVYLHNSTRSFTEPSTRTTSHGFRCARDL